MKRIILILLISCSSAQLWAQNGLKKGDAAPMFTAVDNSGKTIDLKDILKTHKSVVLFFYRGQWCPYCNKYIQRLQDSLQTLTAKGAYVIGVTPETGENINKTINKTHASFSMIQGNTDHMLPVPATYIINKSGKLAYVHFDKDYKKRPTVKSLAEAL